MRALVRPLALRRLRLEPGRTALLILGVALGVGVLVGVRALNATALAAMGSLGQVAVGAAGLVVEGGAAGVPLELARSLREQPGVLAAVPLVSRPAREAAADQDTASSRRVLVLGLDLLDPAARATASGAELGLRLDVRAWAAAERPALVASALAARLGLRAGGTLALYSATGRVELQVVGTFAPRGPAAEAMGGELVVLNLPQAIALFGTPGRVDRVALSLAEGADADEVRARLAVGLEPGLTLRAPGGPDTRHESLMGTMQLGLSLASLLALLIGQFLIYNATAIAVLRRRPELGVLRALGTTRAQLATLLLCEVAAVGLLGACLGVGLGWLLARAGLELVNAQVSQLYAAIDARAVRLDGTTLLLGLLAGPLATVLAAIPPVVAALTVSPVEAARKDLPRRDPRRAIRLLALLGAALLGAALAVFLASARGGLGLPGAAAQQALLVGGAALLAPAWLLVAVPLARPLLARALGPTAALACDALLVRPGRAGVSTAALAVALGGALGIAGLVRSLELAVRGWVERVLVADVYASASSPLGGPGNTLLDAAVQAELVAVPGVEAAYPLRFVFDRVEAPAGAPAQPALLMAFDIEFLATRSRIPLTDSVEGRDLPAAARLIVEDGAEWVGVSSNLARLRGLRAGERLALVTPTGRWTPRAALMAVDYSSEHGSVFVHLPEYRRRWGDTRVNAFDMFVRPGTAPGPVVEELRRRFSARYDLFVHENGPFRARVLEVVESAFTVTHAMQVVAVGVALLGVIATLLATVLERTREMGVLRAIGATRGQLVRAVITEAVLLGGLAASLGALLGGALGLALVARVLTGTYGWELSYVYPAREAAAALVLVPVLAGAAGLLPGLRAAAIVIVRALAWE